MMLWFYERTSEIASLGQGRAMLPDYCSADKQWLQCFTCAQSKGLISCGFYSDNCNEEEYHCSAHPPDLSWPFCQISLQRISTHLTWSCWDFHVNTLVFASSLKRFPLTFECFKLGEEFVLDAEEGISCVAGFLEGFVMLLSENLLQSFSSFLTEKITDIITERQNPHILHCCIQTSAHKHTQKIFPVVEIWSS